MPPDNYVKEPEIFERFPVSMDSKSYKRPKEGEQISPIVRARYLMERGYFNTPDLTPDQLANEIEEIEKAREPENEDDEDKPSHYSYGEGGIPKRRY